VEVDWSKALDLAAAELQRVRTEHGNTAIFGGSYGWASAGRFHHAKTQLERFLNLAGGCTGQVNNYSYGAAMVLLPHVLGTNEYLFGPATSWKTIAENTEIFLALGGTPWRNAQVEAGGCGEHIQRQWTSKARERGMRTINVSPIRDDTSDWQEAEWWAIRPGTDTAFLLALCHTLLVEQLHDASFLTTHCVGFDTFADYLLTGRPGGFNATWAGQICELDPDAIKQLARSIAVYRTMVSLSWSIQRADFGEQPYWAAIALAAMIGQHGLPGGGVGFGYASTNGMGNVGLRARSINLDAFENPTGLDIPVARIADMLLKPGHTLKYNGQDIVFPETRLIYWAGGNPFHHHQDLNRLIKGWKIPDTIIVNEISWTSTARYSDIVFPATTSLERNDIASTSRDRYVMAMKQVTEPYAEARNDFQIFDELATRLGFGHAFTEGRTEMEWLEHLFDEARLSNKKLGIELPTFEKFWEEGVIEYPVAETQHVALRNFREDPDGNPLRTPSGKIEIASKTIASFDLADCPGHPTWLEPREWLGAALASEFPLHLISNQPKTRLHSQLDMLGESKKSKIKDREPARMNPFDAAKRGLQNGDVLKIYNRRGACLAGLIISDDIREGVIQLSTGAWYDAPAGEGSLEIHGNPNVLTHDLGTSSLSWGPSAQSALVEVEKYDGPLPELSVNRPPVIVGARDGWGHVHGANFGNHVVAALGWAARKAGISSQAETIGRMWGMSLRSTPQRSAL
jgi:biotin/methionine sulfoxide reductase